MAVKLSANYSKKLGLPQYSSHSFSASVEVELTDITQVENELQRLYQLLQHSVDQEIQNVGFIPQSNGSNTNGNGQTNNNNGRTYPLSRELRRKIGWLVQALGVMNSVGYSDCISVADTFCS